MCNDACSKVFGIYSLCWQGSVLCADRDLFSVLTGICSLCWQGSVLCADRDLFSVLTGICSLCWQGSVLCADRDLFSVLTGICSLCWQGSVICANRDLFSVLTGICSLCWQGSVICGDRDLFSVLTGFYTRSHDTLNDTYVCLCAYPHTTYTLPRIHSAAQGGCWCPRHQCCLGEWTSSSTSHSNLTSSVYAHEFSVTFFQSRDATGWYFVKVLAGASNLQTFPAPLQTPLMYGRLNKIE